MEDKTENARRWPEMLKSISIFLSSVIISASGILLTYQYNSSQIEINRNKELSALLPKLVSADSSERMQAIVSLSLYGRVAVKPLVSVWGPGSDYVTNRETMNSIVAIGNEAIPALLETYENDYEPALRREWALVTLVMLKYKDCHRLIREALYGQALEYQILRGATLGAGLLKYRDMRPRLIEIVRLFGSNKNYYEITSNAVYSLGELRDPEGKPEVMRMLRNPHYDVRESAITALGRLGSIDDLDTLARMAVSDENSTVREWAWYAMKTIELRSGIEH